MKTNCFPNKGFLLGLFCLSLPVRAQYFQEYLPKEDKAPTYLHFGFSIPLRTHLDPNARIDDGRLLPDGLYTKFGAGLHLNRWLASGLHTGTEWRASEKLVAVPLYLSVRIAPLVKEDLRIYLSPGYGYVFALGRGDLGGWYKKIALGFEDDQTALSVYVEFAEYGFSRDVSGRIRSVSVGCGLFIF